MSAGASTVSVVVPAYRSGPRLGEALASVARQTHPALEVIVVDDGSPDRGVRDIVGQFAGARYVWQETAGPGAARNAGIRAARGAMIAFLDHDDLWEADKLAVQLAVAARHPASGLIACDGIQFDGDRVLRSQLFNGPLARSLDAATAGELETRDYRAVVSVCPISTPSQVLVRRAVLDRVGPLTELRHEASDLEYYLRVVRHCPIALHRDRLVRWRYLPTSHSGPLDRRGFEWTAMSVSVLRRELDACAPEDRPFVAAALRRMVREDTRDAYYYGRLTDAPYARRWLLRMVRRGRPDPVVLAALVALCLPEWMATGLARGIRAAIGTRLGRGENQR